MELTISELEARTGVPRTTIHYYLRHGLLPPAWKSSATRATYRDYHVDRLRLIGRMKAEGRSLEEIRSAIRDEPQPPLPGPDYPAEREVLIRRQILEAAARQFAERGYEGTRVADILDEVGIGRQVFYSLFASKRDLFVATFEVFSESWMQVAEPRIAALPDFVLHQLLRTDAYVSPQEISPFHVQQLRAEGWKLGGDAQKAVDKTFRVMVETVARELACLRTERTPEGLSEELFSRGMLDFATAVLLHVPSADEEARLKAMQALVCLYTVVRALFAGDLDMSDALRRYDDVIRKMAHSPGEALASFGEPAAPEN